MRKEFFDWRKVFSYKLIVICVCSLILSGNILSQKTFSTKKGEVITQAKYYDTVLTAKSNELMMKLDYGKANLEMLVNLDSFSSNADSINAVLKSISNKQISFIGKLGIDLISTQEHIIQNFNLEGNVKYASKNVLVSGKGTLTHITTNGEIASCILWLEFKFNTKKFLWNLPLYGISDTVTVQIIQAVLNKN
jgi:hypothetical protein